MTKKPVFWIVTGVVSLLLMAAGLMIAFRPATFMIIANGETLEHRTRLSEPGQILAEAGVVFHPQDRISPPLGSTLKNNGTIEVLPAVWVQVWEDGALVYEAFSSERLPAQHLQNAGVAWTASSQLLWHGEAIDIKTPLPEANAYVFDIQRTTAFNGQRTSAPTVLDALWEQGIIYSNVDSLSAPWFASPQDHTTVQVKPAREVIVQVDGEQLSGYSAAETVGEALQDIGLPVQALDRTKPALSAPVPENGTISVFRRREVVELQAAYTPYGSQMQPDAELALDGRSLLSPGRSGVEVSRVRSVIEDGEVIETVTEATWSASAPQDEVIGFGQQINTWTIDSEYGPLEVYREVSMYATSYHPCAFKDSCHYTTRNGCTLEKGVVAVAAAWYPYMVGQYVYIPGYGKGVVCDSGYGIPGRYWIDLGFADEDFINWHQYVPVYFLTPVPDTVLWVLP